MMILKWAAAIIIAFIVGKLVSKLRLPSILGWLITGIAVGPYAFSLISDELISQPAYQTLIHVLECTVGFMIGTELVWKKIKNYGKALILTTLVQSLGTFAVVSLVFGIIFFFMDIPVYLAYIFGGIALATAPAPALSIVNEFKTGGSVTKALIPMAAPDCSPLSISPQEPPGNISAQGSEQRRPASTKTCRSILDLRCCLIPEYRWYLRG